MPIELDPVKTAQSRSDFSGVYKLENLTRFRGMLLDESGEIPVELKCMQDEQGLTTLLVNAKADVHITCERCGGSVGISLEVSSVFTPKVRNLDEELVPSEYEIVELNEFGLLNIQEILEDELILALPIIPKHDISECGISQQDTSWGEVEDEPAKTNPFEALQNLKFQKD